MHDLWSPDQNTGFQHTGCKDIYLSLNKGSLRNVTLVGGRETK